MGVFPRLCEYSFGLRDLWDLGGWTCSRTENSKGSFTYTTPFCKQVNSFYVLKILGLNNKVIVGATYIWVVRRLVSQL